MKSRYINLLNQKKLNGTTAAVIRYEDSQHAVPTVVAQGSGKMAQKIMELAKKNQIDIQEDESLVSSLLNVDLGESVPPQLYAVMAEILILLEELDRSY
ncbi:EscU/YscU/HrcU family type III secretion system export apparatus switch protein [Bacillaceae bacterium CLA-AA-H227]|uniref:EscU/YscU/HrcU family type III secretion system export apparatus switch protein n=1 Tax=Robertmurraya yapensis (ex Hitch et al 2024) TaxID=3133160 RepID=A0ACC6SBV4_9BACI